MFIQNCLLLSCSVLQGSLLSLRLIYFFLLLFALCLYLFTFISRESFSVSLSHLNLGRFALQLNKCTGVGASRDNEIAYMLLFRHLEKVGKQWVVTCDSKSDFFAAEHETLGCTKVDSLINLNPVTLDWSGHDLCFVKYGIHCLHVYCNILVKYYFHIYN
jgi:hypothetical protein